MANKARSTQSLVNAYPPWSNIRTDEQSAGFQFLNSIGHLYDDLRKQNERIGANYYLPTSIVSDIDVYYRVQLARDFTFPSPDGDDTELTFAAPVTSGIIDDVAYSIQLATDNTIESFWYDAVPSRLSLGAIASGEHLLVSGYIVYSPFTPLTESGILHIPNQLTVTVSGATSCIGFDENRIRRGLVQIDGLTRAGLEVTEELVFLQDSTKATIHDYSEISQVRVYGIQDETEAFIKVESAKFNEIDYPIVYSLDETVGGQNMPLFWAIGQTETGNNALSLRKYESDDQELRLDGWVDKFTIYNFELRNEDLQNLTIKDIAPEPWSDNMWVVDSGTLYLYDTEIPYPNLTGLQGKNYDADSVIELSSYILASGESLGVSYFWKRPVKGLVRHRVWVEKPDGTKYSIENGSEVAYHVDSSSWIYGEPEINRHLRADDIFTLDQIGNYIYSLEVAYTDETTSIDRRIANVSYKVPRGQWDLLGLIGTSNRIQGIDFDSECKLWVMDTNGVKYEINRHYDLMLADIVKKILYFREPYDQVRVYE